MQFPRTQEAQSYLLTSTLYMTLSFITSHAVSQNPSGPEPITHLGNVHDFVRQHLPHLLLPVLPLVLVGEVDQVRPDGPDLPGDVLGGEGPPSLLLVELEGDLTGPNPAVTR